MADTFTVTLAGENFGNNKSMLGIFNGVGSGAVVRIKRIWLLNNQSVAVTGVMTELEIRRSTAQSGGVTVVPASHDTTNASVPSQVEIAAGATVVSTPASRFKRILWATDEPVVSGTTLDEIECFVPLNCVWDATRRGVVKPITLREGYGLDIRHVGASSTGTVDIIVEFTVAAT